MALDTTLLACITALLIKSIYSLNGLENKVIELRIKIQYLEKFVTKLDRELKHLNNKKEN